MDGSADAELHVPFGEVFDDVPRIRQRAGKPVEFGDDEGVAGPDGGEGFSESGPLLFSAGQSVVDVDPVLKSAEAGESVALRGQVLFVGAYPSVADDVRSHECNCSVCAT